MWPCGEAYKASSSPLARQPKPRSLQSQWPFQQPGHTGLTRIRRTQRLPWSAYRGPTLKIMQGALCLLRGQSSCRRIFFDLNAELMACAAMTAAKGANGGDERRGGDARFRTPGPAYRYVGEKVPTVEPITKAAARTSSKIRGASSNRRGSSFSCRHFRRAARWRHR